MAEDDDLLDALSRALFVDDHELRRRINPKIGRDRFSGLIKQAELRGFPKKRDEWRGRYWPNVQAWLNEDNLIGSTAAPAPAATGQEDGPETFGEAPRRRPKARK